MLATAPDNREISCVTGIARGVTAPFSPRAARSVWSMTALTGLLMVSNFEYYSPKALNIKGRVPFVTLVLVALVFAILLADPPRVMLLVFSVYALSGPAKYGWRMLRRKRSAAAEAGD